MNILFLTIVRFLDINERELYQDLMREFRNRAHSIYVVSPRERRYNEPTSFEKKNNAYILGVRTLNQQKTNFFEKGLATLLVESQYKRAIKRYLRNVKFDLILYSTPPITFPKVIAYMKQQNPKVKTYLLLKDIFPQNAVDLGLLRKSGVKGILYHYFRRKEKRLYSLSDYIGCMSPANVEYIITHNPEVTSTKVEVAPNAVELSERHYSDAKMVVREKYGLPTDKTIFIYGGNLGKPQGISFLIECLGEVKTRDDCYFLIIGDGVEFDRVHQWYLENNPSNVSLFKRLSKVDFDKLTSVCDVGLIFLDHRFTIPNFPSRSLSYMENKLPLLVASDPVSDIGPIAEANGFGFWCESDSVEGFTSILNKMLLADIKSMGAKGFSFLCDNYLVSHTYETIISHFESKDVNGQV